MPLYVTQGALRLGVEGQPAQVVKAGESFFAMVGAHHIINENASATESARAIAMMIVPDGAPLTTLRRGVAGGTQMTARAAAEPEHYATTIPHL